MNHLSNPLTSLTLDDCLSLSPPHSHDKDSRRALPGPDGNGAAAPAQVSTVLHYVPSHSRTCDDRGLKLTEYLPKYALLFLITSDIVICSCLVRKSLLAGQIWGSRVHDAASMQ